MSLICFVPACFIVGPRSCCSSHEPTKSHLFHLFPFLHSVNPFCSHTTKRANFPFIKIINPLPNHPIATTNNPLFLSTHSNPTSNSLKVQDTFSLLTPNTQHDRRNAPLQTLRHPAIPHHHAQSVDSWYSGICAAGYIGDLALYPEEESQEDDGYGLDGLWREEGEKGGARLMMKIWVDSYMFRCLLALMSSRC